MKKATGIISFITTIGWLCFLIYNLIKEPFPADYGSIFAICSMTCLVISTLVYIMLTNFGSFNTKETDRIISENKILKLQIEQKELKKKLEN